MADSNSLTLLPPRSTARLTPDTSANQPPKSTLVSSDETFKNKLEKAKKLKAHAAAKKQLAPTIAKPVKKASADVADKSQLPADPSEKPAKPLQKTQADPTVDEEKAQPKQPDAQNLPVAETAVEYLVEKKPVKVSKPVEGKTAAPVVDASKVAAVVQSPVKTSDAPAKPASVDTKAAAKAVGDEDGDDDAGGPDSSPVKAATVSEFGTGKLVTAGKGDAKDASHDSQLSSDASTQDATAAASAAVIAVPGFTETSVPVDAPAVKSAAHLDSPLADISPVASGLMSSPTAPTAANIAGKAAPVVTLQARFVEDNQPKIISSIQGQLMPHGGTIQLRLDPPELGALSVTVHMRDGVMTASFETSNADATKMLSHSLGQLKAGLEAAGVSVDKIHVEQGSKQDSNGEGSGDGKPAPHEQQRQAQQDQQRREMVQRMWRKLAGGDPLDLVA